MSHKILIIDDEADIREVLADIFEDEGYTVFKAAHSEQAFAQVKKEKPDLVVLDIWLENSDMDGMEILKELGKNKENACPVLMISGHGNIEMAVKAMKLGAYDFIEKPFKIDHMLLTVERALEQSHLRRENAALKHKVGVFGSSYRTHSPQMQAALKSATEIAATDARVLVLGERGTGKSRLASYIHQNSQRQNGSMTAYLAQDLNAATINDIFENEALFKTTILIEQINMMDKASQVALLAVLNKPTTPDRMPRLIATALTDIDKMVEEGSFSSALYNRLAVAKLVVPSLEQRLEDFPEFIDNFSKAICNELNMTPPTFSSEAIIAIQNYKWAANIRQLKAAIEWLIICHSQMATQNMARTITAKDLSFIMEATPVAAPLNGHSNGHAAPVPSTPVADHGGNVAMLGEWLDMPLRDAREAFEKKYLGMLLKRFNGNISQMATHIDMERTALHRKLKTMDLRYDDISMDKPSGFSQSASIMSSSHNAS